MWKKSLLLLSALFLLLVACGGPAQKDVTVEVFSSPAWGCCGDWVAYMEENGYTVQVQDTTDLMAVKDQYNVPPQLQSCHTAIVDGYIVEGHVPVAEIERLLAERPEITGLAVPGMPIGSPGMEVEGAADQPYDVFAFDENGNAEIFASYNQ